MDVESSSELGPCRPESGGAAFLYFNYTTMDTHTVSINHTITSRQLVTNRLTIPSEFWQQSFCNIPHITMPLMTNNHMNDTSTSTGNLVSLAEIYGSLQELYNSVGASPNLTSIVYRLSSILNGLGNRTVDISISEVSYMVRVLV